MVDEKGGCGGEAGMRHRGVVTATTEESGASPSCERLCNGDPQAGVCRA